MRSFDGDADDTASTIPYAEDDVAQISIVSSRESLIEELSLPELCTHHYVPDGPPAPYAESIVDANEQEENDSDAEDNRHSHILVSHVKKPTDDIFLLIFYTCIIGTDFKGSHSRMHLLFSSLLYRQKNHESSRQHRIATTKGRSCPWRRRVAIG